MRFWLLLAMLVAVVMSYQLKSDVCPHDVEEKCVDEVNKAYKSCDEAAKEKGKDTPADLDCLKYFVGLKVDCWPCICQIAAFEGFTIKGCK